MNVLVTGGAGYIGSHAALRLIEDGHRVVVLDDLSRGNRAAVDVLAAAGPVRFVEGDIGDPAAHAEVFEGTTIDAVLHFAALAYVGESVEQPLRYHRVNAAGSILLFEACLARGVRRLVLSSTCAVYGEPDPRSIPIVETCPRAPVNPYGRAKLAAEHALFDAWRADRARGGDLAVAALRYFNVAGCDEAGRLGEDHVPETHLVPIGLDAALGRRDGVAIFGDDYDTPDGTCIRDYVHVDDLVDAHVTVLDAMTSERAAAYNVGTGRGHSVRDVVETCRRVSGVDFPVRVEARRAGDPPALVADPASIERDLGWSARHADLESIVASAWRWRRDHPDGYAQHPRTRAAGTT